MIDDSDLQMQQRRSLQMNRKRATHVEQTSLCPQLPYATHSRLSAHTAHVSSMLFECVNRCVRLIDRIEEDEQRNLTICGS
ncbi:hypothetical protein Hanom_Chr15g01341511 [Helianthus anomalus]